MSNLKNVYFVQVGVMYGSNAYLPYTAGCIAAYAWNNPLIQKNYRLGHFTFLRTPLAQAVASFEEPFLIAFSNYLWNFEYHKALAEAVKERWPESLILFGGHQVLNDSSEQLDEYPYVDFLIHRAGEIPFEKLLLALLQGIDLGEVHSLSYRGVSGVCLRTEKAVCRSCKLPSPYLTGIFDGLLQEYPSISFSMVLETNRGCPYHCAFCDWGTVRNALLLMPMERVEAEIEWAAQHKIEYIYFADGNFGILERDGAIVEFLIESKRRTGYPIKFNACFTKDSNETVFRLNKKLSEYRLNSGATLSFQSISPITLESIGRKNLDIERTKELIALYNQADVPVYTELIIGLPGETYNSFTRGIGTLLASGLHGSIDVFPCELLPNAELSNPEFKEKHGIKGIRVRQYLRHGSPENHDEIPEYSYIVCQTDTMSIGDWVAAYLFSTVVQGLHSLGLMSYFAVFLHFEQRLHYERFYSDLIDYAKTNPSTLIGELLLFFERRYWKFLEGQGECLMYYHSRFGEVEWPLAEALFLCVAFDSERFYKELPAFLQRYIDNRTLTAEVLSQLICYQRLLLRLPKPPPLRQVFDYDFPGYFAAAFAGQWPTLQKKRTTVLFPAQAPISTWADFARDCVWYGRRTGLMARKGYTIIYDE